MPITAFVSPQLLPFRRDQRLAARPQTVPRRAHIIVAAKKKPGKKGSPPAKPPPSSASGSGDSFASFAAGPSSAPKPRLSRPTKAAQSPTADSPSEPAASSPSPDTPAAEPSAETDKSRLRATRALGTSEPRKNEKIGRKTAADFIAEGVVDDIDDDNIGDSLDDFKQFAAADIRYGIADVKDPFLEDETAQQTRQREEAAAAEREAVGRAIDVMGDGGVSKRLINPGTGEVVVQGATVRVEYTGRLEDGTQFDSSRGREGGFSFTLGAGAVIKGWEAGVATMRVGETAEFTIAPGYAYGRRGMPPVIPGNAVLTFEIEVVSSEGGDDQTIKNVAAYNPDISRTPEAIARDYEQMLETQEERRQGKTWLQRLYFISPFMSQTGEKPPWWINPNITFSLIAVSVVIGFYLVLKSNAIHIGYSENVDVNIFK